MLKSPSSDFTALAGARLQGRLAPVAELDEPTRGGMFALLQRYFQGVTPERFAADLWEKEWAILLEDRDDGRLAGFSTLMALRDDFAGRPITALYSGDTIIDRAYWGARVLPRLWARDVHALADRLRQDGPVYWLLICSGYRTYRFLPVFYREFHPACDRPFPPELRALRDRLAGRKFGRQYQAATGIVRFHEPTPLRPGVAELTPERLKDSQVAFFTAANPGHAAGDELVCLTELSRANLTRAGLRMLGGVL
jgi:hypothetical protein